MTVFAHLAAAVFALLGLMHTVYTLHDFGARPRYFAPVNKELLQSMKKTHTAIAPTGSDYWSGILGFNLSHSLGLVLFSTLIYVTTTHHIGWLKIALIAVGATYSAISARCWFRAPTMCSLTATFMMAVGWWL
jgi:hypothetical protein